MRMNSVLKSALILIGLLAFAGQGHTQSYPNRLVRIIVPYSAGGLTDVVARLVAEELQAALKQPFIVENQPGAAGQIGHKEVIKSGNDGYTLLSSASGPLSTMPHTRVDLGYDPIRAFAPIKLIGISELVLVVNPKVKANTVAELVKEAKGLGGKMTYGSWGEGSPSHLVAEMFRDASGAPILHVPYKGSAPAINDLLGGHIDMLFEAVSSVLPHIRAGKLKPIALTTAERSKVLPELPTMIEAGYPTVIIFTWYGLLAPAGTPPEIVNTLSKVLDESLAKKSFQDKLLTQGVIAKGGTPEEFGKFLRTQLEKMGKAVKAAGIKPQ